ncbi:MAG: hypothetical protein AAF366_14310 [Pseudomonadota bacterium]
MNAPAAQTISRSVRRLRGFTASFEAQMESTAEQTGTTFELSHDRLAAAFLDWREEFERQKPDAPEDRIAYVSFAAGLMLRALMAHDPVRARPAPNADPASPAAFWPEGHLYTAYCLNIRNIVLQEKIEAAPGDVPEMDDLRVWESFRENAHEDPARAIAFLDLFSGGEPDWAAPATFRSERYQALIRRICEQIG